MQDAMKDATQAAILAPASARPLCIQAAIHATRGAYNASEVTYEVSLHLAPLEAATRGTP